jgi:hypothetical protein
MASKMILIPQEAINKLQNNEEQMTKLDSEMNIIMKKKVSDREKWTMYNQVLQRYLQIAEEKRQPVKLPISSDTDYLEETVISSVPPSYKSKVQEVYRILRHSSNIKWNDSGLVSVNGVSINGSNIVDLLNDILRQRKDVNPTGWKEFAKGLRDLNIPKEFVGNKVRWQYMHQIGAGIKWETFRFK